MEFDYHGERVRLHGMHHSNATTTSPAALKHNTRSQPDNQYFHLCVSLDDNHHVTDLTPTTPIDPSAPSLFVDQLQHLLTAYSDIFSMPTGLPP